MIRALAMPAVVACCLFAPMTAANAGITIFFDPSQTATLTASGITSDTIASRGYLFTYTRDKLFTGGTGQVIGRTVRVPWPEGVEAQAVTTPSPGVTDYKARITIQRVDGQPFDLTALTFRLLANTAGAGGTLEIMPMLNGEDGFADPIYFDATGYSWSTFSYDESPNYWGTTALLKGYDTYKIGLYVDFALVGLTLDSSAVPGDFDHDTDVDPADLAAFQLCAAGPAIPVTGNCLLTDLDYDNDVDQSDFGILQHCWTGPDRPGDPNCGG